jgi:hypothetical protein
MRTVLVAVGVCGACSVTPANSILWDLQCWFFY